MTKPIQRPRVDSYTDSLDMPVDMLMSNKPQNTELDQMLCDLEKNVNGMNTIIVTVKYLCHHWITCRIYKHLYVMPLLESLSTENTYCTRVWLLIWFLLSTVVRKFTSLGKNCQKRTYWYFWFAWNSIMLFSYCREATEINRCSRLACSRSALWQSYWCYKWLWELSETQSELRI